MRLLIILFLLYSLGCSKQTSCETEPYSWFPPKSYVSDYAAMLKAEEIDSLSSKISSVNKSADINLTILTINEVPADLDIKEFSVGWGNCYGLGEKKKNNGVLLCIANSERKVFLATGDGVMQRLTDEECALIIEEEIKKNFRNGYYFEGISEAIEKVGEYAVE